MRRNGICHVLGTWPLFGSVVEPLEHIQHGLGILLLLLLADVGVHQESRPCLRHALKKATG